MFRIIIFSISSIFIICLLTSFIYFQSIYDTSTLYFLPKNSSNFGSSVYQKRHHTRLIIAYMPDATNAKVYIPQTFGLIESWKTVISHPVHIDEYKNLTHIYQSKNVDSIKMFKTETGKLVLNWLELLRHQLDKNNPFKNATDYILQRIFPYTPLFPEGPPVITDILIVSAPENTSPTTHHPECTVLDDALDDKGYENRLLQIDLPRRLEKAKKKLKLLEKHSDYFNIKELAEEAKLGESRCFFLKDFLHMTEIDNVIRFHPPLNSISVLLGLFSKNIIQQYDLVLRTDCDTFVTPQINDVRLIPWKIKHPVFKNESSQDTFWTGRGGYTVQSVQDNLFLYSKFLGLRYQNMSNIGSTWYGKTEYIQKAAELSVEIGRFLLSHDSLFKSESEIYGKGTWPTWFRSVVSMYSGDLAVNHLIDQHLVVKGNKLDEETDIAKSFFENPVLHMHTWQNNHFFSKYIEYPEDMVYDENNTLDKNSWYAFNHNQAARHIEKYLIKKNNGTQVKSNFEKLNLLDEKFYPVLSNYLKCPTSHQYSYLSGKYCCKTEKTCTLEKLDSYSNCCQGNNFIKCPFDYCNISVTDNETDNEIPLRHKFLKYFMKNRLSQFQSISF